MMLNTLRELNPITWKTITFTIVGFLQIVGRGACLLVRSYVFRTAFGKYFENAVNDTAGSLPKDFG